MKSHIILLLAAGVLLTSCLDENPQYSQNGKTVFSTESNAEMALLGCYGYMSTNNGYGQIWQEVPVFGSGLSVCRQNGNDSPGFLASLTQVPSNDLVGLAWDGMYKVIGEVNAFVESVDGSELDDEAKARLDGEARFLRAIAYYNLVAHFGDVPKKLSVPSADDIDMPRSPREEIFNEIVLPDLQFAMENLPETNVEGRLDATAAVAFLGKVYYKMAMLDIDRQANLANAKSCFDDVYGKYALDADPWGNIFSDEVQYSSKSPEVIIQITYDNSSTVCFNRSSNRFAPQQSTTNGTTNGTNRVAKFIYDLQRGTYADDPRLNINYLTRYKRCGVAAAAAPYMCTYPYRTTAPGNAGNNIEVGLPYELFADPTNPTLAELNTFVGETQKETNQTKQLWNYFTTPGAVGIQIWPYYGKLFDTRQTAQYSHRPVIVYRYSELLLLMADVYNELGDTPRAIDLANEVLARARNIGGPDGSPAAQPADWPKSLTQSQVTEKLYFERIFELIGEPSIYDMVRVRGTEYLNKLLVLNNRHNITRECAINNQTASALFSDHLFDNGSETQLSEDFLKRNLLLPVPTSEIDANPGISNDNNNYGY